MEFHKILKRQLAHFEIGENTIPNMEQWHAFLERINIC